MPDVATIIAIVGGILGILGAGGAMAAILMWRQLKREHTQAIWDSYERQIRGAQARDDSAEVQRLRREYEGQIEAWRAQQGVERLAPTEILAAGERPSLTEEEVERLRGLLVQAEPLSPSALSARAYFLRGNAYYQAGQYEQALDAYNRSLELRPDDPATVSNRGASLDDLGRYEEALAASNRSLELEPDHPATLNNRGNTLGHLGRYEEALADYNRSLQLRPDHVITLYNRGVALGNLGRHEDALVAYDRALQIRPDHPETLHNRGVTLQALGRYGEALAIYDRVLQLVLDDPDTCYNRACLFAIQGKADEAIADLRRAIAGDPGNREMARTDSDFDGIRADPGFRALVGEEEPPPQAGASP